jgi:hypothetical protein
MVLAYLTGVDIKSIEIEGFHENSDNITLSGLYPQHGQINSIAGLSIQYNLIRTDAGMPASH